MMKFKYKIVKIDVFVSVKLTRCHEIVAKGSSEHFEFCFYPI